MRSSKTSSSPPRPASRSRPRRSRPIPQRSGTASSGTSWRASSARACRARRPSRWPGSPPHGGVRVRSTCPDAGPGAWAGSSSSPPQATRPHPLRIDIMRAADISDDITDVLLTEEQIQGKLTELAEQVTADYAGKDLLLVGVLKGAVMVMADFARQLPGHIQMDWMAVSSYGAGTRSSGVVQIRKDLDSDLHGRHVLIVEDIIDSGLTLSWLRSEEHTSELQSLMRISYAVFCLKKKIHQHNHEYTTIIE